MVNRKPKVLMVWVWQVGLLEVNWRSQAIDVYAAGMNVFSLFHHTSIHLEPSTLSPYVVMGV